MSFYLIAKHFVRQPLIASLRLGQWNPFRGCNLAAVRPYTVRYVPTTKHSAHFQLKVMQDRFITLGTNAERGGPPIMTHLLGAASVQMEQLVTSTLIERSLNRHSISMSLTLPHSAPGPLVDEHRTELVRLSRAHLVADASLAQNLFDLLNNAFRSTHVPPFFGITMERYPTVEDMMKSIRPNAVIWILLQGEQSVDTFGTRRLLGTVQVVPYEHPTGDADTMNGPDSSWDVLITPSKSQSESELPLVLKSLAVDSNLHGRGLGGYMLGVSEDGAIELARNVGCTHAHLAATTTKEVNGAFYSRRGWDVNTRFIHQPPYYGSTVAITAVQVEKILLADK